MKTLTSVLVALVLTLSMAFTAFADGGNTGGGGGDIQFADVTVKATCSADPKTVTVTNDSEFEVTVISVSLAAESLENFDNLDMQDMMGNLGENEPVIEDDQLAAGESKTYTAPEGAEGNNFVVLLTALDSDLATDQQPESARITVVVAACAEIDDLSQMPGMPQTGAGGMTGASLPLGSLGAAASFLLAGAYAVRRRS